MAKVDMTMVPAEFVAESGRYKPGHDAKHVSILVAEAKEGGFKVGVVRELAKQLPTPALKEKFEKAIERAKNPPLKASQTPEAIAAREAKKAEREAAAKVKADAKAKAAADKKAEADATPKFKDLEVLDAEAIIRSEETPDVKIGRNFYPARKSFTQDGGIVVEINSAKDGSGKWVIAPVQPVAAPAE